MPQQRRHEHDTPRPSTRSDRQRVVSEVSSKVLNALEAVANYFPIPGIAQAAGVALRISDTVQKAKVNQVALSTLADDAAQLIYVIFCTYKDMTKEEDIDANLKTNLDDVLKVLLDIQEFVNHSASRGKIAGFLLSIADEDKIMDCRRRLQHCLTKFGFESDITIQLMVTKLAAQNEKITKLLEKLQNESDNQGHDALNSIQTVDHDVQKSGATQEPVSQTITFGTGANFSGASGIAIGSRNQVTLTSHNGSQSVQ